MKKNLPLVIVAAVLVLGVGGYLLMGGKGKQSNQSGSSVATQEKKTVAEKFTGSLKEAVAMGVGMKCTYKVGENEYEGYVKGKNYRGKMKNVDGRVGEIIMKDNCMWTWSEDETQGLKTCFEEVDEETGEPIDMWDQLEMGSGSGAGMSYSCVPFAVTDAQFTPPSNVEFMDLEQMMQGFDY